jgi:hypothetical protein
MVTHGRIATKMFCLTSAAKQRAQSRKSKKCGVFASLAVENGGGAAKADERVRPDARFVLT